MKKTVIIAILGIITSVIMYMTYSWLHRLRHFDIPEAGFHMTFERMGWDDIDSCVVFRIYIDSTEKCTRKNYIEVGHRSIDMPNIDIYRLYDSIDNNIRLRDTIYANNDYGYIRKVVSQDYNIVQMDFYFNSLTAEGWWSDSTMFYAKHKVTISMSEYLKTASIFRDTTYVREVGGFWDGLLWR